MGKAIASAEWHIRYVQGNHKRTAKKRSISFWKKYMRTREMRRLRKKRLFPLVAKLILEKKTLTKKMLKRIELTPAEKERVPILFRKIDLKRINSHEEQHKTWAEHDQKAEDILKRVKDGEVKNEDICFIIPYLGGLKPAIRSAAFLTITYNDRIAAKDPKKMLSEGTLEKYWRKRLAKEEQNTNAQNQKQN